MKKQLIFLTIITAFILGGCASPMRAFQKNSSNWLPGDFDPKTGILLIEIAGQPRQQRKIEAFMKESYSYKYEFVSRKMIDDQLKGGTGAYRFALLSSYSTHTVTSRDRPVTIGMYDYNFIDLSTKKEYSKSGIGSSWASTTYIAIIKEILKKKA